MTPATESQHLSHAHDAETQGQVATWPMLSRDAILARRKVACANLCKVHFDDASEAVLSHQRETTDDIVLPGGRRQWPLVLILRPGETPVADPSQDPPDG